VALAAGYRLSKAGKINEYIEAVRLYRNSLKRKKIARKLKNDLPGWYWYKPELSIGYVKYNQKPIICNLQLIRLGNQASERVADITSPIFFMGSRKDSIITPESLEMLFHNVGSQDKSIYWLENSSHMLPVDGEREIVFQQIDQFIKKVVEGLD
jgi:esterase/lipase